MNDIKIPKVINNFTFDDQRGVLIKNIFDESVFNIKESTTTFSKINSARGLHFQVNEEQPKIVTVIFGEILDFCLDVRKESKTYGKMFVYKLTNAKNSLFIPKGFAHGYFSLKDSVVSMLYGEKTNSNQKGYSLIPFLEKMKLMDENTIISNNDKKWEIFKK